MDYQTITDILIYRATNQYEENIYTFLSYVGNKEFALTYGELHKKANSIAKELLCELKSGDRALLLYPSGLDFIESFFACLLAGIVAVPAYPPRKNHKAERLQSIIEDCEAKVILTDTSSLNIVENSFKENSSLKIHKIINTSTIKASDIVSLNYTPQKSDIAFLQYTSGSTGDPKGVMVTHGNIVDNSQIIQNAFSHNINSFQVCWLPMFHDMGLLGGIIQPLYVGFPVVLMSPTSFIQKPFRWLKAISDYKATVGGAPNFAYELCVNSITEEELSSINLDSWRVAFCGAEPVQHETFQKFTEKFGKCGFKSATPYPCYGMAETTLFLTGNKAHEGYKNITLDGDLLKVNKIKKADATTLNRCNYVSCGKAYGDHIIKIVNPETRIECAKDEVGEIWTKGSSVTKGYWNKKHVNDEIFNASLDNNGESSFLRTGDLGFIYDDELFIAGRLKDLIIIRGRNYYPQDIERIVGRSHPALQENSTAAFVIEENTIEQLVVIQELKRTAVNDFNALEIVNAIRASVSEFFDIQVSYISLIGPLQIPKTSSGKIQRRLCREKYTKNALNVLFNHSQELDQKSSGPTQSKAPAEKDSHKADVLSKKKITRLLSDKLIDLLSLKKDEIDVYAAFSSFGMDSIKAVRLSGDIQEILGIELSDTIIYDYPTIDSLANYLSESFNPVFSGKEDLKDEDKPLNEPIAIIGMSCNFPGAEDIQSFWRLLSNSEDSISEPPLCRTKLNSKIIQPAGYLKNIEKFDADFFGISPKEAKVMDPQQRILLQESYNALISAGINLPELAGSNTGVFIGISQNDYSRICIKSTENDSPYLGTGSAMSIAANRLSYFYDLKGPSIALDTACSSSLVAVHQAVNSIRRGESDLAIVGGVNLNLTTDIYHSLAKANMLASDNRCKVFDSSADGYVRSEGCGFVILKPLSKALDNKDCIQALIKGSAIEQDGRSNGLSAPNRLAQQNVIRKALSDAQLLPGDLSFIETHGTGTKLGDPIEVEAISEVYGKSGNKQKLLIGAVKANIGHLESAAGIAGLIKTVLCLQNRALPKQLHFNTPNPHIKWDHINIEVPKKLTALPAIEDKPLRAGVSSFGFGGMNAHLILEEASPVQEEKKLEHIPVLLTISAKAEEALETLVESYHKHISNCQESSLPNICYTANTSNENFAYRFAATGIDKEDILFKLLSNKSKDAVYQVTNISIPSPKVAFLFTGQGSQYVNMGKSLYYSQPEFRKALDYCDCVLGNHAGMSILRILFPQNEKDSSLLDQTEFTQPALLAIEYALLKLWQSWGINPDIVLGHSVGEYAAAVAAGVMSIEHALQLVYKRGQLMQQLPLNGGMVSVKIAQLKILDYIKAYQEKVSVAAINGLEHVVISGEKSALDEICNNLEASGYITTTLQVSHAFHSPLMEPMLKEFKAFADKIPFNSPGIPLISNTTGELAGDEIVSASYWVDHIIKPVLFYKSLKTLDKTEADILVEIGPKPVLLGMARQVVNNAFKVFLPSLSSTGDAKQLLLSAGELYRCGVNIDWKGVYHQTIMQKVMLPRYPFKGRSYWVEMAEQKNHLKLPNAFINENSIFSLLERGDHITIIEQLKRSETLNQEHIESLPKILKLITAKYQEELAFDSFKDDFYKVQWKPIQKDISKIGPRQANYLIFADRDGVAEKLAEELENQDCQCSLVYPSDCYKKISARKYQIDPSKASDFINLINDIKETSDSSINNVVHLWATDGVTNEDFTLDTLKPAQLKCFGTVLHLVQSLLSTSIKPKIWLITRAAQAVEPKDKISLSQSSLWGLGRVISLESPQLWGGMIDLDGQIYENDAQIILKVISDSSGEDHWAIRNQQAFVARLTKHFPEPSTLKQLDSEGTYIITGGLGYLGLHTAEWMVEKGARNLLLLGRSKPGADANKAINKLREKEGRITVIQADVCNEAEIAKIIKQIDNTIAPLKGIIHAAGIAEHQFIKDMKYADVESLMDPKVIGSWNLHQLTKDMKLDFFVTYSSISSVWGSAGQAQYAAGNHFLDALASYRHSAGLKATNINWGPWDGGGMADQKKLEELFKRGLTPLSLEKGKKALECLVGSNLHAIIAEVDWAHFKPLYEIAGRRSLLGEIEGEPGEKILLPSLQKTYILSQLEAAPASEQLMLLTAYLQKVVAQVLELRDFQSLSLEKGFAEMGIDSLMAVELKNLIQNNLHINLPVTLIFEYPSINTLAEYLLKDIFNWDNSLLEEVVVENTNADFDHQIIKQKIQQLSEKEVEDFLNQELEN